MKNVIVKFREYYSEASSTEKGVIEYLLEHPEEVAEMGLRELAKATYVSSSTITRLCHKAGFSQYKDFQKSLIYENALRKETITGKNCEIAKDDNLEQLVNKIIYKSIVSLEDTQALIDIEILDKSVSLMMAAQKIAFFGMGASLLVGKDAYLKFLRINKNCMANEDIHMQMVQAKNLSGKDVAVIISYSGMTKEIVECARIAREAGAHIIAVTCFNESPLSKLAECNLYVSATEFEFQTGKLASRLSQLAVIDMLYTACVQRNYEECMHYLKYTYIPKTAKEKEGEDDA